MGLITLYFGVKRKGITEERERQETKRVEEVAKAQVEVNKAVSKDEEIDQVVRKQIEEIKRHPNIPKPGSDSKFRF